MHPTLTVKPKRANNLKIKPKELQVLVVFAEGDKGYSKGTRILNLIDTPIRPNALESTASDLAKHEQTPRVPPPSILHYSGEPFGQPNVRLLPNLTETYYNNWTLEGWNQRAVLAANKYHILFTQFKEKKSFSNAWLDVLVSGDVLILKLSDSANDDGTWSYQDILPNETERVMFELGDSRWQWMPLLVAAW